MFSFSAFFLSSVVSPVSSHGRAVLDNSWPTVSTCAARSCSSRRITIVFFRYLRIGQSALPLFRQTADLSAQTYLSKAARSLWLNVLAPHIGWPPTCRAMWRGSTMLKAESTAEGHKYTSVLLRERAQELEVLEQRHQGGQLSHDEYRSCRRALLQAISEINNVVASNRTSG